MGAGQRDDHYKQDAAELYLAFKLQHITEKNKKAITISSPKLKAIYIKYCDDRGIDPFDASKNIYMSNIDGMYEKFFDDLVSHYPKDKFAFICNEKELRNLKKKGDILIHFSSGRPAISLSVKNYKNGYQSIQLNSGTWNSFLNNFLFVQNGVGSYINSLGESFRGNNPIARKKALKDLGYSSLESVYTELDEMNSLIRVKYVDGENSQNWFNIEDEWKSDCAYLATNAMKIIITALDKLSPNVIKNRVLDMSGLSGDEELLLIGPNGYMCSLFNVVYRNIVQQARNQTSRVSYHIHKKSIVFQLINGTTTLINIEVPFTLQKNGAWHLPSECYTGKQYHPKEGVYLKYGDRRPKKSKEIATSINTYMRILKYIG